MRALADRVTAKKVIATHSKTPLAAPNRAPIWRSNSCSRTRLMKPATTRNNSQMASDVPA